MNEYFWLERTNFSQRKVSSRKWGWGDTCFMQVLSWRRVDYDSRERVIEKMELEQVFMPFRLYQSLPSWT
jgi:hypothetical protein